MSWPVLAFDIESIPDLAGLRALGSVALPPAQPQQSPLASADASPQADPAAQASAAKPNPDTDTASTQTSPPEADPDQALYAAWLAQRQAAGQSDFMPLYLQRVLVISVVFRNAEGLRVHSFVDRDGASEGRVIQQFFNSVEKHQPQLVSWNGGGFDLPVLHYRGLRHGVVADKYWDLGDDDREYKWNNYISRYHLRHLDLMDLLALYQPKNNAPLDALAKLCGFPGKLGMDGSKVFDAYRAGQLDDIRRYCETDVMNTYLMYCRFQKMRGGLTEGEYAQEIDFVKQTLGNLAPQEPHWNEYLGAWQATG